MFDVATRNWLLFFILPGIIGGCLSYLGTRVRREWLQVSLWVIAILVVLLAVGRRPDTVEPWLIWTLPVAIHIGLRVCFCPKRLLN